MKDVQILEANGKPTFVVLPYAKYKALLELADDADDARALAQFAKRYGRGEEETVPVAIVDRLMSGEVPLRVWREHRGLTAARLAAAVQITPAHVSKLESGKGEPSVGLLRKLAKALEVDIDMLVGPADDEPNATEPISAGAAPRQKPSRARKRA